MTQTLEPVELSARASPVRPVLVGTACCVVAALGYSGSNVILRALAGRADLVWVLCMKETVATVVVGPWLLWQAARGHRVLPGTGALVLLVLAGLATQLLGNLPVVWSLGVVGLAVTIPIALGVNLLAGALLGRVVLGERVSPRSLAAIFILIAAIVLLSGGARGTDAPSAHAGGGGPAAVVPRAALAVGGCCLAGVVFAGLSVAIRRSATRGVSHALIVFLIPAAGPFVLGPVCVARLGAERLLATAPQDFALMIASGVLNLVAFVALIQGLRLITLVQANAVSATQVAMAACMGAVLFREPVGTALALGVALTVAGALLIDRKSTAAVPLEEQI